MKAWGYILIGAAMIFSPDIINDSYYGYSIPFLGLLKVRAFLGFTLPFEVVVGMKLLGIILVAMGIYSWWVEVRTPESSILF